MKQMKNFTGIPISNGVAVGKIFLFIDTELPEIPRFHIEKQQVKDEWRRFLDAVKAVKANIENALRVQKNLGGDEEAILYAHLMMLEDPDFHDQIKRRLETNYQNIERALWEVSQEIVKKLVALPNVALRERASDVVDVTKNLLYSLLSIKKPSLENLSEDAIVAASELLPSDTVSMDRNHIKAIVMDTGTQTSHIAIIAKAFGIPAVFGLSTLTKEVAQGQSVIVNGGTGEVIINPDAETLKQYKQIMRGITKENKDFEPLKTLPAETWDGHRVALNANIEFPAEVEQVLFYGAEGIGLYRSEFLFMQAGHAEEEAQYYAYRQVIEAMGGKPVTIRTIDVGGDKILPGMKTFEEKNPLLGCRAIRFSLSHPEVFKTQLRAILRASAYGNVKILFPMISCIKELEQALALFEAMKAECRAKGQPFSESIEAGSMIEVPAAAMSADILAEKSAFFSLGTNDLIQYTLAIDRNNERVSYLSKPFHPAVIRFIKKTIDEAHRAGIKAAMCGELAGDTRATALLLGLGLDEFSMTASLIPRVKKIIRGTSVRLCRDLAEKALACKTADETEMLVKEWEKAEKKDDF
jgi:phosphotransferase system enzyme I (PtsI)